MKKWKITYHAEHGDMYYTISVYPTIRDEYGVARVLFIDERTGLSMNKPYQKCSIDEVRE